MCPDAWRHTDFYVYTKSAKQLLTNISNFVYIKLNLYFGDRMLKEFTSYLTYNAIKLEHGSRLADVTEFFIYDTIKIFLLLLVIIFIVSIIRSYFPPERTKKILSYKK